MYKSRAPQPDADADGWWVAKEAQELVKVKMVEAEIELADELAEDTSVYENIGKHMRALQDRIEALEANQERKDWGVFQAGTAYAKGAVVSHNGAGWIARRDHAEGVPGSPDSGWRMFSKSKGNV
jgi:hypothetical protein